MESNTYLAHHGILGMKWGIRRFQNKDGVLTAAGKARYRTNKKGSNKPATKKQTAKPASSNNVQNSQYKPVSEMSDQELRDFLNRRDLEKRYLDAITPKAIEKSKSLAEKAAADFGEKLVSKLVEKSSEAIAKKITDALFGNGNSDKSDGSNKSEKKKEDTKKSKDDKKVSEEQRIKNEKAAYELERQKLADKKADKAEKEAKREAHREVWREAEARWNANEQAFYEQARREAEEERRRKQYALPPARW